MKQLYTLLLAGLSLTSCVSTSKYAQFVEQKPKTERPEQVQQSDWLIVQAPPAAQKSNYLKLENSFIPAIVYWGWNSTISCELDPGSTAVHVQRGMHQAAQKLNLQHVLGDRQLVVELQQLPGQFLYENKGSTVFLLFMHMTSAQEVITPRPTNLIVRYYLKEHGEVIASGESIVPNEEQPIRNLWKSTKKFTWMHLDLLESESERMGMAALTSIAKELEAFPYQTAAE
ncbi:hypothetical protein I0P70_11550 [Pontibacter sp. FD36]|uniref:hypothetical protein n=1 Tax=Pontibacter sp. FD36 TaxID=2789860 RepID=UPI0018A8FAB8|nr:hypothetical protein [Pontibacter sp. FD36]MBF8963885.1 hypothetical protein [Pontibacter sp. FD36]